MQKPICAIYVAIAIGNFLWAYPLHESWITYFVTKKHVHLVSNIMFYTGEPVPTQAFK